MPLNKTKGNMYSWVTHTHSHLGGECPHKCSYCYVDNPRWGRPARYTGELRLIENEFKVNYGTGKTIFVEHCNDLFAEDVPIKFIYKIFGHCFQYPDNIYVFQTKNPIRYSKIALNLIIGNSILGTTIESNRYFPQMKNTPMPFERMRAMERIKEFKKFVTIEPVMDFDVAVLEDWIIKINPEFVNIGADSKGHKLPEPPIEKVHALIDRLQKANIEIREKNNLDRLKAEK